MSFTFDYLRHTRIGLPESVFCESKDVAILNKIVSELTRKKDHPTLFTRLSSEKFSMLKPALAKNLKYDPISRTAFLNGTFPKKRSSFVAIVMAGTSDRSVALETARTLEHLGIPSHVFSESGVAGIWRLEKHLKEINRADVVIVVAGMDAALASVMGGLVSKPLIAVPTSVGYGVAKSGKTALNSMLASCAPGITVVNIDNGYGAACATFRILNRQK